MELPVMPPVAPMLAKAAKTIPPGMHYEAKWDGFRAIIFRDGADIEIGSRNEKPLTRYFPELVASAAAYLPSRCVVDGEIIIARDEQLDFDALLNRIHPAASRIEILAAQTPAAFVAFDLLALDDQDLTGQPFARRRELLVNAAARMAGSTFHVTPATRDLSVAEHWFKVLEGAGLDGLVAKSLAGRYEPGKRTMIKIKHERTADCVVAGFRWHKSGPVVGSLLLGLYDGFGTLHQVGVVAAFSMARRAELVELLAPYRLSPNSPGKHPWLPAQESDSTAARRPGSQTRWNSGKDLAWEPLELSLVVEVAYDQMQGDRFRHTAQFWRWRPDREPDSCTYGQLERPITASLSSVLREL